MIPDFVQPDLARMGVELTREQLDRLARYLDQLLDANERMNLTGVTDPAAAWRRLILDSLTLLPGLASLHADAQVIDVGTGGGLPGVPLAIARPDLRFTLLDATGKKVRFLEQTLPAVGLNATRTIQARAEELAQLAQHRQRYDLAVSRAVGKVGEVLEYALPLVRIGGRLLMVKGRHAESELAAAGDALLTLGGGDVAVFEGYPEGFDSELVIISVVKARPTPDAYPRRPGLPRHEPL